MATTVTTCCNYKQLLKDATNTHQQRSSLATCLEVQSTDKVKRCLFGAPDHQVVRSDLSALRRQLDAQSRQRWNFDFRSGTPLTSVPLSTATSGGTARWAWTRVSEPVLSRQDSLSHGRSVADSGRRLSLSVHAHLLRSPSPRRLLDRPNSTVKRRRMSLTPSVEVKSKVTSSEVKAVSCRKSVSGMERRRLLRSTSLLVSPSRMLNNTSSSVGHVIMYSRHQHNK